MISCTRATAMFMSKQLMHIYIVDENSFQSVKVETPKCQIDTFKCTLEELAVLDIIKI